MPSRATENTYTIYENRPLHNIQTDTGTPAERHNIESKGRRDTRHLSNTKPGHGPQSDRRSKASNYENG